VVTAVSTAAASRSDAIRITVTDAALPTLGEVTATVRSGSRVELAWSVADAERIDVECATARGTRLETLPGTATGTTIPLPDSSCRTLRVVASGPEGTTDVTATPDGVVTTGRDSAPGEEPIPGSLRAVLATADPGSVVGFASDVHDVALVAKAFSGPHDAHLVLDRDVTVSAPEGARVTVRSDASLAADAAGVAVQRTRVLYVPEGVNVRLERLVVRDGTFTSAGGAIRNDGDLTIVDAILEENRAHYRGGAIHNLGSLRIEDSVLRGNRALVTDAELAAGFACIDDVRRTCTEGDEARLSFGQGGSGGAIYQESGSTELIRTVLRGNVAAYSGGGIYVGSGTFELVASDLLDNVASDASVGFDTYSLGGGLASFSRDGVTLTGGEVRGNVSTNVGGGIANGSDRRPDRPLTLRDVLVTENRAGEFGGGLIHYVGGDSESLRELGSTEIRGNVAGDAVGGGDGDDRSYAQGRAAEER
jgi:predicted outer membrane repeat protein